MPPRSVLSTMGSLKSGFAPVFFVNTRTCGARRGALWLICCSQEVLPAVTAYVLPSAQGGTGKK